MKKRLLTLCISLFCALAQAQTTTLTESFYGDWITTDGSNKFVYGLHKDVALMDNMIWDYTSVKKKGSAIELNLKTDHQIKTLFVKLSKTGNLLVSSNNKSFTEYSREFSESKTTNSDWVFSPEKYRNKLYKPGKAVLRGFISDYSPKAGFKTSTFRIEDIAIQKQNAILVDIQPNGQFEAVFDLEHPINILSMEISTNLFISPGDTLLICCNLKDGMKPESRTNMNNLSLRCMGNRESSEVNNMKTVMKSKLTADDFDFRRYSEAQQKEVADIMKMRDTYLTDIKQLQDSLPLIFAHYNMSDYAKDVIFTDMITLKFLFISEMEGNYAMRNRSGELPPLKDYHNFIDENMIKLIFDNPLIITNSMNGTLVNRVEFSELFPRDYAQKNQDRNHRKQIISYAIEKEKIEMTDRLKTYSDQFIEKGSTPNDIPEIILLNQLYSTYFTKIPYPLQTTAEQKEINFNYYRRFGLDRCVMYDYCLLRELSNNFQFRPDLTNNQRLEEVSAILPYIKTPFLSGKIVETYANNVKPKEEVKQTNSKADELFERIIAPYKGNVLLIDFWSTGCGPCRSGMIADRDVLEKLKDKKIKFLYITDETQSPMKDYTKFLTENNIKGEQIRISQDEWNYMSAKFNIYAIPHRVLVDKNGRIIKHKVNNLEPNELLNLEQK